MTWGLVATAGGAILGAYSSSRAAKTQANAVRQGMESQERMYEQTRADQEKYRLAGEEAINALRPLSMDYRPFTAERMYNDPGYAFRLSEGQKMLDRQAAARGGLISGGALKATARYGQDYASGEYNNALNRYLAERNAQLGPLQFLVNAGQGAANASSSAATNFGNTQAQGYSDIGNAQASGYMGMANAVSGAANNYLGYQNSQNYINAMRPGSAYSGTGMPSYSLWSPGTRIGSGIGG
jgi:hypothetical protein